MGREGRAAVRRSWAGRGNSGERFRPRGGDLRGAKALAGFSRDRGDTGNYSGQQHPANPGGPPARAGHRRGRAPAKAKLDEHRAQ
jgi:hypothetical protein